MDQYVEELKKREQLIAEFTNTKKELEQLQKQNEYYILYQKIAEAIVNSGKNSDIEFEQLINKQIPLPEGLEDQLKKSQELKISQNMTDKKISQIINLLVPSESQKTTNSIEIIEKYKKIVEEMNSFNSEI